MADPTPVAVTFSLSAVQYTDVNQFDWFAGQLTTTFGASCNPTTDPDGSTIRWTGMYSEGTLPLSSWLVGTLVYTDEQLRASTLRPLAEWPA